MKKILLGLALISTLVAQSAYALPALPTSGSCAFLITQPIPYGSTPTTGTGYNFLGQITFTGATSATLSTSITNASFTSASTPPIAAVGFSLNNASVIITSMTTSTGFVGGYVLVASGPVYINGVANGKTGQLTINAVPTNGGNTILLQFGGAANPGIGAGSGVCQF